MLKHMHRFMIFLLAAVLYSAVEPTSKANANLQRILKRYPQADANKDGVLTLTEAKAFQKKRQDREVNRPKLKPTNADIIYGPHKRNRLDLWLPETDEPTPLLVCIHGGGFRGGDKSKYHMQVSLIKSMHKAGISVASINYRFTEGGKNPLPISMHDAARAIQYLRHHAKKYNLNKTRFAATGSSAGACISLWLAFHEDLADSDNDDPILRESTRLIATVPVGGQPTLSQRTFEQWFGVKALVEHPAMRAIYGLPPGGKIKWTGELEAHARAISPITYLTRDDPACYMVYGAADTKITPSSPPNEWVHHPRLGLKLKEAMDRMGVESHVQYKGGPKVESYQDQVEFLINKLTGK